MTLQHLALVILRKMQCVKSAKDERHGPVSAAFRDRTIAEGSRDGRVHTSHL